MLEPVTFQSAKHLHYPLALGCVEWAAFLSLDYRDMSIRTPLSHKGIENISSELGRVGLDGNLKRHAGSMDQSRSEAECILIKHGWLKGVLGSGGEV